MNTYYLVSLNKIKYIITPEFFFVLLTLFSFTVFPYFTIYRVPLYIIFLAISFYIIIYKNKFEISFFKEELRFYIGILFFAIYIYIQYLFIRDYKLFFAIASFLSGFLLIFIYKYSIKNMTQLLLIIKIFIIIQIIGGLIAIFQAFLGFPDFRGLLKGSYYLWHRPYGFEGMIYSFAKNYIFPIIFIFYALKYKIYEQTSIFSKKFLIFSFYFFIFVLILSKTRSTQLALIIMFLIYLIKKYKLFKLKYILIGIFLVLFFIFLIYMNISYFIDTSSLTRFILWYSGILMFLDHPFMGVGFGLFGKYYPLYNNVFLDFIGDNYDHNVKAPHNLFLGIFSETGIIGFIILLYSFYNYFNLIKKFIKIFENENINKNNLYLTIIKSIFYSLIAFYFIDFQFHNYWNDNNQWFFIGILIALMNIYYNSYKNNYNFKELNAK